MKRITATPATIWDTQTSQLEVDASDADGGPLPLSYNWIVPAGAGSVSDPAIANPVYTPADVTLTQVFTLTVEVSDGAETVSNTVDITVSDGLIFLARFNAGTDGFAYLDDLFNNTTQPLYASGVLVGYGGGFTGGALQINLGGIDNNDVLGMSGGWQTTFNLAEAGTVRLAFMYNLTQSSQYENTEFSDMMLSIDNVLIGTVATDYIARITGDGNGGRPITTGWQFFETTQVLPAGVHTINIGGYNNRKNAPNESTTILIDDVLLVRN